MVPDSSSTQNGRVLTASGIWKAFLHVQMLNRVTNFEKFWKGYPWVWHLGSRATCQTLLSICSGCNQPHWKERVEGRKICRRHHCSCKIQRNRIDRGPDEQANGSQARRTQWVGYRLARQRQNWCTVWRSSLQNFGHAGQISRMWGGCLCWIYLAIIRIELTWQDLHLVNAARHWAGLEAGQTERTEIDKTVGINAIEPAQSGWGWKIVFAPVKTDYYLFVPTTGSWIL